MIQIKTKQYEYTNANKEPSPNFLSENFKIHKYSQFDGVGIRCRELISKSIWHMPLSILNIERHFILQCHECEAIIVCAVRTHARTYHIK